MRTPPNNNIACFRRSAGRRGFSFIEILFALFILGIGLTMVAAVFPVAIQQTQAAMDQTTAIAVVEEGRRVMDQFLREQFVKTANNNTFCTESSWTQVKIGEYKSSAQLHYTDLTRCRDRISSIDPRFAWVPLVLFPQQDTNGSNTTPERVHIAWTYIIPVRSGTKNLYDVTNGNINELNALMGSLAPGYYAASGRNVTLRRDNVGTSYIVLTGTARERAAEGAYVLISKNPPTGQMLRGSYYRLAFTTDDRTTWQVTLEKELPIAPGASVPVDAFIIGRSLVNPLVAYNSSSNPYGGPLLDVTVPNIGPFPVVFNRK